MCIARRTVIAEAHKAQLDRAEAEAIEAARRSVEQAKWQKYANLIDEGPEIPENPAKYFAADEPRAAPHDDAGVGSGPPAADHGTGWAWPNPSCTALVMDQRGHDAVQRVRAGSVLGEVVPSLVNAVSSSRQGRYSAGGDERADQDEGGDDPAHRLRPLRVG
jgi:hypothetical protein